MAKKAKAKSKRKTIVVKSKTKRLTVIEHGEERALTALIDVLRDVSDSFEFYNITDELFNDFEPLFVKLDDVIEEMRTKLEDEYEVNYED
jgi:hypothetical protein